ncbi:MAG: alanyl-tRNA editing protein [Hyphomicrobiales bacterium]|nr:alanyl-tRNA editing protein [Hyphomicrobiales bacterium]
MTEQVFRDQPYERECSARVVHINERGGIIVDRTNFYATGGGQPGDCGLLIRAGKPDLAIATTVYGDDKTEIVHVPNEQDALPEPGDEVQLVLDWERRHRHMRVHTSMHLMCSLVPFPVTGGQIAADGGRLDFDIDDAGAITKEGLTAELNRLISEDHPVTDRWITDAEMAANPGLVRTMSVKPPMGSGHVRLVAIGEDGSVDLQPCGGTHVRSTAEIGEVAVTKIENKGKQNRRIRISLL